MPLALTALISAGIVMLDRLSKFFLMDADSVLIPGLIRLTGTRNTGAAFSLFSDSAWVLPLVTALLTLAVLIYIIKTRPKGLMGAALAVLLGGAAGNLIDRIRLDYVVDFLDFRMIKFAIFNFADLFVVFGSILLVIALLANKNFFENNDFSKIK